MHQKTVEDVIKMNPGKVVYVSCNPATQVRDIKLLINGGFKINKNTTRRYVPPYLSYRKCIVADKGLSIL